MKWTVALNEITVLHRPQVLITSRHSIFHSTHFLEEITRFTSETNRTEVITELREAKKEREKNVGMCLLLRSQKSKNKFPSLVQGIIIKITSSGFRSPFGDTVK